MASSENSNVASSLSKLSIDSSKHISKTTKPKLKKSIVDSWEDEEVSDNDSQESDDETEEGSAPKSAALVAPPPTPASPNRDTTPEWASMTIPNSSSSGVPSARRPEKTDAVARRMIAAGLGLKAPKQTEEQKAYQRSIREQERKKKEQEKEEEQRQRELTEKAKAAVWDD